LISPADNRLVQVDPGAQDGWITTRLDFLVNWARAVIVLKPTDVEGEFELVLAKRGTRAGVMQEVQGETTTFLQVTTKIAIKQRRNRRF
jgi:hypothetical protein